MLLVVENEPREDRPEPETPADPFWAKFTQAITFWAISDLPDLADVLRAGVRLNTTLIDDTLDITVAGDREHRLSFQLSAGRLTVTIRGREGYSAQFVAVVTRPVPSTSVVRHSGEAIEDLVFAHACLSGWCVGLAGTRQRTRPAAAERSWAFRRVHHATVAGV